MINKRIQDENFPKIMEGWIKVVIPALIALLGVIYRGMIDIKIEKMKEEYDKESRESESMINQKFNNKCEIIEKSGIEYMQYTISSSPVVAGYHVIAYPYLVYEKENKKKVYIPITGQFTQVEYVAEETGRCILLREDLSEELQTMITFKWGFSVEIKCLIAFQYVEDEQEKREFYDIRDGELTKSEQEVAVEVVQAWRDENFVKIDVRSWPHIDQNNLEKVFR